MYVAAHSKFLKWNNPPSIFETVHYHIGILEDIKMKNLSLSANGTEHGQTSRMSQWELSLSAGLKPVIISTTLKLKARRPQQ